MLIELNQMVHCLRKLQHQSSEDAEDRLNEICLNSNSLRSFKIILGDNMIEESTKKMAAVFLKNYLSEQYSDLDEILFIEIIMSIIMDEKLSYKYKILLEDVIVIMIEWIQKENLSQVIDCIQNAFFSLEKTSGREWVSNQKRNLKKRNMDSTKLDLSKYCCLELKTQTDFFNLAYSIVHLVECFSSVSGIEADDLHRVIRVSLVPSLSIFPIKNTETHLRLQVVILHMWLGYLEVIESEIQNCPQMKNIRQEIMEEELVWNKIVEIYEYLAYQYSEMSQDKVYACSSVEQYKNLINKAKNYACQIHIKMLEYEIPLPSSVYLSKTLAPVMFARLFKTLSFFSTDRKSIQTCESEQFINSLLSLLICLCQASPETIDNSWTNLLHLIVLPLLTMDENEFHSFQQEPDEFLKLAEDCCDKQNLGELKTEAARFLETICDRNPTYYQYVVQYAILGLQARIGQPNSIIKTQMQSSLSMILPIESAFLILAILSYNLCRFPLELATLSHLLKVPYQYQPVELTRIFLFLSYNFNEVFKNPLEGKDLVEFAMRADLDYPTKKAAFDFLHNVVDDYFEEEFILKFSQKLLSENQLRQVWEVIGKLLNSHLQKISESTNVFLIQKVFERLSQQITLYNSKKIKSTQNISQGLELLRKILGNHSYTMNKPKILEQIWKVVPLYKTFKALNLQDIVLKMVSEFMNYNKSGVEEIFVKMLDELIEEFRGFGYRGSEFYWIWNQFIFKSQNSSIVLKIQNLLLQSVMYLHIQATNNKKSVSSNLPMGHSLLLLQHLLILHPNNSNTKELKQIYEVCRQLIPEDINEPERLNIAPQIIGRALIVMVICQMLVKSQQGNACMNEKHSGGVNNAFLSKINVNVPKDEIVQMNSLKYLLKYHDEEEVFAGQNGTVIAKLLCKQLFTETDPVSITQIINISVRVLRPSQEKKQSKKSKRKKEPKNSMKIRLKKKENYEQILNKIQSPFNDPPAAEQQLKECLGKMKENNELLYRSILSYLTSDVKQKLREILSLDVMKGTEKSDEKKTRIILKVGNVRAHNMNQEESEILNSNKKRAAMFDDDERELENDDDDQNSLQLENEKEDEQRKNMLKNNKKMKKLKHNELIQ